MFRGGVLARFYRPGGGGFELLFCPGEREFAHQKSCPGGLSGLELTDTQGEIAFSEQIFLVLTTCIPNMIKLGYII